MKVLTRYLLLQVPGWALLLLVMVALRAWRGLPVWLVVAVVAAWIAKDFVLYPFVKSAYDPAQARSPADLLVGARGIAEQDLDPEGYVRIRGELWAATCGTGFVKHGEAVRVSRVDRMRLIVEPDR